MKKMIRVVLGLLVLLDVTIATGCVAKTDAEKFEASEKTIYVAKDESAIFVEDYKKVVRNFVEERTGIVVAEDFIRATIQNSALDNYILVYECLTANGDYIVYDIDSQDQYSIINALLWGKIVIKNGQYYFVDNTMDINEKISLDSRDWVLDGEVIR